jgi:hypothetical protein
VITAVACVFFLTGCGAASDSTSSVVPDASHTESTAQPTATPTVTPTPNPTATPIPDLKADSTAEPDSTPEAESSETEEKSLFDPASADYTGSVVEMTDTGFTLSPTVVERLGANASVGVMAEAGASSSWFSVMCTDDTRYIAIYADGNGSSSQAEGSADMVQAGAMVYITGINTDSGFTADTVAILNP